MKNVIVGKEKWNEQDDHSKWVYASNDHACFGDMNRMPSQWKRGGSFFCLNNYSLALALKRAIIDSDKC